MTQEILIVEDETKIAKLLADYLESDGFVTHTIGDGRAVVDWLRDHRVDAILLDIMLPGKDGMTICREARAFSNVPILMITARVDEIDRLLGLDIGADDYICKPFSPREVVARVKAVLRRMAGPQAAAHDWHLDEDRFEFAWHDERVALTSVEFNLLKRLCGDPGRIFSRDQLMSVMYPDNRIVSERTIDSHVKKLRAKLAAAEDAEDFIESVYGIGYRFIK